MDGELENREPERLSPEQQTEVLRLAARLQAQDADRLSPQQLARIASEAGIEERFVHEAVAKIKKTETRHLTLIEPDKSAIKTFHTAAAVFGVAQVWAAFVALDFDYNYSLGRGYTLYATGLFALVLGLLSLAGVKGRKHGLSWIVSTATLSLLIAWLFLVGFIGNPVNPFGFKWACAGVVVQVASFFLGRFLRGFGKAVHRAADEPVPLPKI
jgi:hypothetical protein